jgi:hypothetical protein
VSRGGLRRTSAESGSKRPRPSQSSPSSGIAGKEATNHGGAATDRPLRWRSVPPSQSARTPSYFSLTQQSAGSTCPAYTEASCGANPATAGPGPAARAATARENGSAAATIRSLRRAKNNERSDMNGAPAIA